jgi:hypothetical protein
MEYKVIIAGYKSDLEDAAKSLEEQVNKAIAEGWQPVGGVAVVKDHYPFLLQAMIRRM